MVLRCIRFLTSRSFGVGMASLHISPMFMRLTNSRGFSVGLIAYELNRSNNLLFLVLRIDPSTSQSEGHSSVTLRDANSAYSKVHVGVCKIRCIMWLPSS